MDELLNCEDSTFRLESPALESKSAISHSESAVSGHCSKIGENRGSDSARDSGERIPSKFVINGVESESQVCGRVLYLLMRNTLEKWKSLCLLRRIYMALVEAGETASSTWEQGIFDTCHGYVQCLGRHICLHCSLRTGRQLAADTVR